MEGRFVGMNLQAILPTLVFFTMITRMTCQSCGPRVSARLLAEIPCDMSESSYCSVPGSAYPWQSVKRYIFDNQGLVRRMYGDERHNSVISKEMNEYRMRYNAHFLDSGTLLRFGRGRSIRGRTKPSRRQSRPQIFTDEPPKESLTTTIKSTTNLTPTEETIFRVVTETSVKIGEDTSPALPSLTATSTFTSLTQQDTESTPNITTLPTITTGQNVEQDTTPTTVKQRLTTKEFPISSEENVTLVPNDATDQTSTLNEPTLMAMKRVSFDDDYEYGEISKKKFSPSPQNSVEEKIKDKDYEELRHESDKLNEDGVEDLVMEETEGEDTKENGDEDNEDESVPRRGINACPVKNEVIAPYWANNTRGDTLALLNVYPFEQYVHFEKCAFENHQMLCREGCRCEQQYRLHRLLAFDPRNECRGIFSDWFRFPSCCVCICYDLTPDLPRTRTRTARLK